MPELPEVETVCRALKPILEGHSFVRIQTNRADLRYPLPLNLENQLAGHLIVEVKRRAKYLLLDFAHGLTLIWHLGMSGRVIFSNLEGPTRKQGPHDHVIFTTCRQQITYCDPRRFGFLRIVPTDLLSTINPFSALGPEPVDNPNFNNQMFFSALKNRNISLKSALLDQKLIAGIGNIYASEALWQAKLSPLRITNTLSLEEALLLLKEVQDVLRRAIQAGGSTLRDHKQPNGEIGYFQHSFKAYNRENKPCGHGCCTLLTKIMQNGRATYYCKTCQQ